MRARFGFVVIAFAMAFVGIIPAAKAQNPGAQDPEKWMWVCHHKGNGEFNLLITGESAAARHVANHDGDTAYERFFPFVPPSCP